jgi:hypothetical protein
MDQEEKQRNYDIAEVLLSEQNFAVAAAVSFKQISHRYLRIEELIRLVE